MTEYKVEMLALAQHELAGRLPMEQRVNDLAQDGWRPILVTMVDQPFYVVVFERCPG